MLLQGVPTLRDSPPHPTLIKGPPNFTGSTHESPESYLLVDPTANEIVK